MSVNISETHGSPFQITGVAIYSHPIPPHPPLRGGGGHPTLCLPPGSATA